MDTNEIFQMTIHIPWCISVYLNLNPRAFWGIRQTFDHPRDVDNISLLSQKVRSIMDDLQQARDIQTALSMEVMPQDVQVGLVFRPEHFLNAQQVL